MISKLKSIDDLLKSAQSAVSSKLQSFGQPRTSVKTNTKPINWGHLLNRTTPNQTGINTQIPKTLNANSFQFKPMATPSQSLHSTIRQAGSNFLEGLMAEPGTIRADESAISPFNLGSYAGGNPIGAGVVGGVTGTVKAAKGAKPLIRSGMKELRRLVDDVDAVRIRYLTDKMHKLGNVSIPETNEVFALADKVGIAPQALRGKTADQVLAELGGLLTKQQGRLKVPSVPVPRNPIPQFDIPKLDTVRLDDSLKGFDIPKLDLSGKRPALKSGQEAFGAVAGLELDEEGNASFDPTKAALGLVGIGSVNAARNKMGGLKAGNVNLKNLNISKTAKTKVKREVTKLKNEIEQVRGKKLTNAEVVEAAQEADVLSKVVTRADTQAFTAQLLKLRQAVSAGARGKGVTPEFIDSLKALSSQATDAGRRLQSFSIGADPMLDSTKAKLVSRLLKLGHDSEEILRAARGVDFADNRQAVAFYRQFEKAGLREILEEYRYMNLLSSPRTHIVNVFSNAIQTGVLRPATRTAEALIDPVAAALTGRKREVYLKEVPAYYRGMFGAIPEAFATVRDVLSGKQAFTNLDLDRIPTNSRLSKINVVTPALEAMDQFFQTLVRGGERSALTARGGLSKTEIAKRSTEAGQYSVFRQGLKPEGQGAVLNWVDEGTKAIMRLRKVPGMGWFVPFIQTPMNIFKQGIEYSPFGATTAIGATNKTEQLAKSAVGSMVFAGAGYLALQDRITWAAPKDPEQRKAFYAAGMQPYSVKVGDKWVGFSKIGPVAYPLALAAAIKHSYQDNPQAVAKGDMEKMGDALTGIMSFFSDQSYMQGIGDLVSAVEGQEGYQSTTATAVGNVAGQYVPLASLQRWVTQIIDPYYRKGDSIVGNIAKGIPGLSTGVGTYEDPLGNPSQRQFPLANAFSPLPVTEQNEPFTRLYEARQANLQQNALARAFKEGKDVPQSTINRVVGDVSAQGSTGNTALDEKITKFEINAAVEQVRISDEPAWVGGVYIYKDGDSVRKIDTDDLSVEAPKLTGKEAVDKKLISSYKGKITAKANDVVKLYEQGVITADQAEALLNDLEAQRSKVAGGGGSGKKLSGMPSLKFTGVGTSTRSSNPIGSQAGTIRRLRLSDAKPITAPRLQ